MTAGLCVLLAFGSSACARSVNPETGYKTGINDPLEGMNRGIFAFNNIVDIAIIEPVAKAYNFLLPSFFRDGVQNFMHNLRSPLIVGNQLLQGDLKGAGVATARFIINTTAGIGGLVDVASAQGLPYEPEDFGQTLAVWGLGDGFYLVLPIVGPSSLRDTGGMVADGLADPVRIWAHDTDNDWIYYTRVGVEGLDTRARLVRAVEDLRANSLDYYAAVRSAYSQKRQSLIRDEKAGDSASIPDYDNN
ncbi:MAG TPA: VacJ family lipoprotein [Patescibacteria group bacterium]|nr:VacJ family lipoprotein [Patescibacteria group bacterium]